MVFLNTVTASWVVISNIIATYCPIMLNTIIDCAMVILNTTDDHVYTVFLAVTMQIGGVAGDGYTSGGLTSVNTENERFAGLTVAKAAEV